jgi:hypothetical protein
LIGGGGSKFLNFFRLSAAAARDFKIFFACRRRRLNILSWPAAAAGKFKNEEFSRK